MSVSDQVFQSIAHCGGDEIDPPIIIEAAVPLELSGEVVRSRICTFVDAEGREWALRPDLTLPVAQAEIAARRDGLTGETVRRYRGPVFRLPAIAGEPVEYEQIGLERFGANRGVEEDVWLFEALAEACVAAGLDTGQTSFGDLSIFPAFVDALNVPADVAAGLKRAFRQEGGVRAYLAGRSEKRTGITSRLKGMDRGEVAAFVDEIYAMTGLRPIGERSADEIVERLHQSAASESGSGMSEEVDRILTELLSMDVRYQDAPAALARLADEAGLNDLDSVLSAFAQRTERLTQVGYEGLLTSARFATRFGRRFTYYDGFVFEISSGNMERAMKRPIAAGGRYDSLLASLSDDQVDATAIGGILSPHRLVSTSGDAA